MINDLYGRMVSGPMAGKRMTYVGDYKLLVDLDNLYNLYLQ